MPAFFYVAAIALILFLVWFVGWSWSNPVGGVIIVIVGVVYFLSGTPAVGVVIGIIGAVCFLHAISVAAEETKKSAAKKKSNLEYELMEAENEIMAQCWNSNTCEFNWSKWRDRKYELLFDDSDLKIREYIHEDFRCKGQLQVVHINGFLQRMRNTGASQSAEIRRRERMVLDLHSMFVEPYAQCSGSDAALFQKVEQYRQDLLDYIVYRNKTLTPSKLDDMIRRGEAIYRA